MTWLLTAACLLGSWLNARKLKSCFLIWIACNAGWLAFDIYNKNFARAALDIAQAAISVYGYVTWNEKGR